MPGGDGSYINEDPRRADPRRVQKIEQTKPSVDPLVERARVEDFLRDQASKRRTQLSPTEVDDMLKYMQDIRTGQNPRSRK